MAEETVKRVTGVNPLLVAMSQSHMPFVNSQMPMQSNTQFFHQNVSAFASTTPPHHHNLEAPPLVGNSQNDVASKMTDLPSAHHISDVDHVQKQSMHGSMSGWDAEASPAAAAAAAPSNHKKN